MRNIEKTLSIFTYIVYAIIVTILAFFIVFNANWIIGDQWQNIRTTGLGQIMHSTDFCFPNNGRCWPFALLHYNILVLLQCTSPTAHYILNLLLFIIFSVTIFITINKSIPKRETSSVWNSSIILLASSYLLFREHFVFLDLIYGETILALLFAIFMICAIQFYRINNLFCGILALLCAVYATYCKEPTFAVFITFGATMLIFNFKKLTRNQKIISFLLIANAIVFLIVYLVLYKRDSGYCPSQYGTTLFSILFTYMMQKKILLIAIPLTLWRLFKIIIYPEREHIFYDALLFGGMAYILVICILRLLSAYYILPALVLITPAIIYFIYLYFKEKISVLFWLAFACFYGMKAHKRICVVQDDFQNDHCVVEILKEYRDNGYQVVYYQADSTNYNWYHTLIQYRYSGYSGLMAYYENDPQYQIPIVTRMPKENAICLYPTENDFNYPGPHFRYQPEYKTNINTRDSLICNYQLEKVFSRKGVDAYLYQSPINRN